MQKTILITGSTDGIGLETAKMLADDGHRVLMHGRNPKKLDAAMHAVDGETEGYVADLSRIADVHTLAREVTAKHETLDVLVNNAGVLKTPQMITPDGHDVRFVVNTLAPYALTKELLPIIKPDGRIINLSSAAQAPVNIEAIRGMVRLSDMEAYAQSKLAITMWSKLLADDLPNGPMVLAVNPGSLLASKMVKEGFGVAGNDLKIGAHLLCRASLSEEFATASGRYFDNDAGRFNDPHRDALDRSKSEKVLAAIEEILGGLVG